MSVLEQLLLRRTRAMQVLGGIIALREALPDNGIKIPL